MASEMVDRLHGIPKVDFGWVVMNSRLLCRWADPIHNDNSNENNKITTRLAFHEQRCRGPQVESQAKCHPRHPADDA
jgi:hypothetical protein